MRAQRDLQARNLRVGGSVNGRCDRQRTGERDERNEAAHESDQFGPRSPPPPRLYDPLMAYDEELAERIRALIGPAPDVTEKSMFGGLAFLVGGNMAIAASGQGGILVRVDPDESETLVDSTPAEVAVMRGRPMAGWLRVASDDVAGSELAQWVERGTSYARSLPTKR
jgi:TfoX/Sxy family transcriptional regulator of competence genes